jgi:hypothetical protein
MGKATCSSQKHTSSTHKARVWRGCVFKHTFHLRHWPTRGKGSLRVSHARRQPPGGSLSLSAESNYLQLSLMTGAQKSLQEPHLAKQYAPQSFTVHNISLPKRFPGPVLDQTEACDLDV